jgi:hypothetical protein
MANRVVCLINGVDYGYGDERALISLSVRPAGPDVVGDADLLFYKAGGGGYEFRVMRRIDLYQVNGSDVVTRNYLNGFIVLPDTSLIKGTNTKTFSVRCTDLNVLLDTLVIRAEWSHEVAVETDQTIADIVAEIVAAAQSPPGMTGSAPTAIDVSVDNDFLSGATLYDYAIANNIEMGPFLYFQGVSLRDMMQRVCEEIRRVNPAARPRFYISATGPPAVGGTVLHLEDALDTPTPSLYLSDTPGVPTSAYKKILEYKRSLDGTKLTTWQQLQSDVSTNSTSTPVVVTVGAGGADIGDTVVPVDPPLSATIPIGITLDFGGGKTATIRYPAFGGDNTISVEELEDDLDEDDTATYTPGEREQVVRTIVEATDAGSIVAHPNPYSIDRAWKLKPVVRDGLDPLAAQATINARIAALAGPRESISVTTPEWAPPGSVVALTWVLDGLEDTEYQVAECSVDFSIPQYPRSNLTLGARKLQLGEDGDEDIVVRATERDTTGPRTPTGFTVTPDLGGGVYGTYNPADDKVYVTFSWDAPPLPNDVQDYEVTIITPARTHMPGTSALSLTFALTPNTQFQAAVTAYDFGRNGSAYSAWTSGLTAPAVTPLLYNPDFEYPDPADPTLPDGWERAVTGAGVVQLVAGTAGNGLVRSGSRSLGLGASSGTASATSTAFYVKESETYVFGGWVREAAASTGVSLDLKVQWLDADGADLGAPDTLNGAAIVPTATWTYYEYKISPDAGATAARLIIATNGNQADGTYIDALVQPERLADADHSGLLEKGKIARIDSITGTGNINVASGKTLTVSNTLTLAGVDSSTLTIPATGTAALLGTANIFTAQQAIALASNVPLIIQNTTTSSTTQGSVMRLGCNDGAAMNSGHRLGGLGLAGNDGTAADTQFTGAGIFAYAAALWTTSDRPTRLTIETAPVASSVRVVRLNIESDGNIGIGAAGSYGSGAGVLSIANAATNPSTNPTGGGILYSDAGAGKWRGSSGTVTTFGPADPHCDECGRDFMLEYENERYGYVSLCVGCLSDYLGNRNWIKKIKPKGKN